MFQVVIRDRGGTIEADFFHARPASVSVSLYNAQGTAKVSSAAASLDSVQTTLTASCDGGDGSVTVTDATGIVSGRRYAIGSQDAAEPVEQVTVKSVSGATVTLWAPVVYAHTLGSTFAGTRASYVVGAAAADTLWWDGYADWVADTGVVITEAVDCALRPINTYGCTEADLWLVFPKGRGMLDPELDIPAAIREARDQMLFDLGGKVRAHTMLGSDHFRRPIALKFWLNRRHTFGDDWSAEFDRIQKVYDQALNDVRAQTPVDADQDGSTSGTDDRAWSVMSLERA